MKYQLIFEMKGFEPDIFNGIYAGLPETMNSFLESRLRTFAREMLNVQCDSNSKYITDKAIETAIAKDEIRYVLVPEVKSKKVINEALQCFIEKLAEIGSIEKPVEMPRVEKTKLQRALTKPNPRRDVAETLRAYATQD